MKISYKAALLSTFVFPGAGQLYLKQYSRALAMIFPVFIGLVYVIRSITVSILDHLDDIMVKAQGGAANLQELSDTIESTLLTKGPYADTVVYVIICIWIFSIIDAYRIGKRGEFPDH